VLTCGARFGGAGNGVIASKSKSFDLLFNLLPRLGCAGENDSIATLKVRPQLVVVEETVVGVFHR
jgi:hypothetical protein